MISTLDSVSTMISYILLVRKQTSSTSAALDLYDKIWQ